MSRTNELLIPTIYYETTFRRPRHLPELSQPVLTSNYELHGCRFWFSFLFCLRTYALIYFIGPLRNHPLLELYHINFYFIIVLKKNNNKIYIQ